jgi:hypothetical protein
MNVLRDGKPLPRGSVRLEELKILGLTVHSPWAELIASGHKTVECRSWPPYEWMLGKYIAVHASTRWDQEGHDFLERNAGRFKVITPRPESCAHGIVAVAQLVGWVRRTELGTPGGPTVVRMLPGHGFSEQDWRWFHIAEYGWILRDVTRILAVAVKGRQGFWPLPPLVYSSVRKRWQAARASSQRC